MGALVAVLRGCDCDNSLRSARCLAGLSVCFVADLCGSCCACRKRWWRYLAWHQRRTQCAPWVSHRGRRSSHPTAGSGVGRQLWHLGRCLFRVRLLASVRPEKRRPMERHFCGRADRRHASCALYVLSRRGLICCYSLLLVVLVAVEVLPKGLFDAFTRLSPCLA